MTSRSDVLYLQKIFIMKRIGLFFCGLFLWFHSSAQITIEFEYIMPLCWGSNTGFITALPDGGSGSYNYQWSSGETTALADSLIGGLYTVTVTDANTAEVVADSFYLHQPDPLSLNAVLTHNLCYNDTAGSIVLQTQGGTGPYDYSWIGHTAFTGPAQTGLFADLYTVVVSDANGCSVAQTYEISQIHHEAIRPDLQITPVSCRDGLEDGEVRIDNVYNISGDPLFVWQGAIYSEAVFDSLASGIYEVIISDTNGCQIMVAVEVPYQDVPCVVIYNGFSPNGDGINDVWDIDNIFLFPDATVRVWNMDGKLLFESEQGYQNPWDGTVNSKLLPPSTVYYEVNLQVSTYNPYTGFVRIEY
jgi:gliding motility-associated-like protein